MVQYGRVVVAFLALVWLAASPAYACGRERWAAKVLADGSVLPPTAVAADIDALRGLPRPYGVGGMDSPRVGAERRLYSVRGELLGFKLEKDGDIHLIVAESGDREHTMIAEIPDPQCMDGAPEAYVRDVAQARLAFVKAYGIPPVRTFRLAYRPIELTGPIFFDFGHSQDGAAPNQAEIHPVLAVGGAAALAAGAARAPATKSRASNGCAADDVLVWVNTRSGVYHLPGSRWYGNTRHGEYLCKRQADADGYRPSANGS